MHIETSRGKMRIRQGPGDARCELPGVPSQWSTQLSQKCDVTTANREVHLGLVTRDLLGTNHIGVANLSLQRLQSSSGYNMAH